MRASESQGEPSRAREDKIARESNGEQMESNGDQWRAEGNKGCQWRVTESMGHHGDQERGRKAIE